MAHLTREQILARKTGRGKATLPDGSTVAIRALTRNEVLEMQSLPELADRDNYVVHKGVTDPALSLADVEAWAAAADAGDMVALTEAVQELSGLGQGAGKSRVPAAGR